eukprot:scaffold23232_cov131-Isochrysis_galbana.AAC.1
MPPRSMVALEDGIDSSMRTYGLVIGVRTLKTYGDACVPTPAVLKYDVVSVHGPSTPGPCTTRWSNGYPLRLASVPKTSTAVTVLSVCTVMKVPPALSMLYSVSRGGLNSDDGSAPALKSATVTLAMRLTRGTIAPFLRRATSCRSTIIPPSDTSVITNRQYRDVACVVSGVVTDPPDMPMLTPSWIPASVHTPSSEAARFR